MRFRTKIVLWYCTIVLATLVAFQLASVRLIEELLDSEFDESLRAEARWAVRLIRDHRARGVPDAEIVEELAERSRLAPRKELIEVADDEGHVLYRSSNLEGSSLRGLARPPLEEPSDTTLRGLPVRVLVAESPGLEVAIGYPLTDVDAVVGNLDSFLYLIPLAIALAGAGGFFLASRFLRSIEEMGHYADRAVALPLDQDLPPLTASSADEIGGLIERIHHLVEQLRENLRRAIGFSSLASHELRTPLAVLRAQMEDALRSDTGEEELRETLASTYDEVLRLASVVEGLLDLSTMQAGTLRIQREPVDLASLLESFPEDIRPLCESQDVDLVLELGARPILLGDSSRLRQVLFNLVDNALEHTPEGGRIVLGLAVEDDHAVLRVEDTGSGIPTAALDRIFDPFFRAEEKSDHPGAGLGLALVRWIVEAHGGTVEARSRLWEGTRFTLRFPLSRKT
jgi:signal transduction histidine kinase